MEASSTKQWAFGDKVVHTGKPEWGTGVVTAATGTQHEGVPCQSLTIRFDRAGVKTLSTAFAKLAPPDISLAATLAGHDDAEAEDSGSPLDEPNPLVARNPRDIMTRLPEATRDPFTTPMARFEATLKLYRFTPTGASLLDWAAVQSGLSDPMSRFNRHELEKFFEAFAVVRDAHLKKLALEIKRTDPAGLSRAIAKAPPIAQQVLRRFDGLR